MIFSYRGTHTQAHMYNQHTRGMATTTHRNLVGSSRRQAVIRDKGLAHKKGGNKGLKYQGKPDIHE